MILVMCKKQKEAAHWDCLTQTQKLAQDKKSVDAMAEELTPAIAQLVERRTVDP